MRGSWVLGENSHLPPGAHSRVPLSSGAVLPFCTAASRPVLSQRQNWAAGYESTKTSLNCTPLLRGLVPTYVHTRQTQGLPCHARQQPKASGNSKSSPSPPSHPHSCHPSCANTSTDEPQPPHPGDKHCAQLAAAGHLRKFRGRPRLGFCPTPTLLQAPGPAKWQGARGKETK